MSGKRYSERKARRNGLYLALAVCLVAVGIAAWSTYDAVTSYTAPPDTAEEGFSSVPDATRDGSARTEEALRPAETARPDRDPGSIGSGSGSGSPSENRRSTDGQTPAVTASPDPARETAGAPEQAAGKAAEDEEAAQTPVNGPLYELSGEMMYPLSSRDVTKAYSAGAPVYSATMKDWRVHTGADLAAEAGEEVRACANGQVLRTYSDAMLGNVLLIEHGDYTFSYCGVAENFQVKEGDIVTKGQVIGTVTAVPSESADPVHLHLEVRRDTVWMDPQAVIEGRA